MNTYHLLPDSDGWKLITRDADRAGVGTKQDAVRRASEELEVRGGSLKIHREDGTIEEERTFPRAADPRKSPG